MGAELRENFMRDPVSVRLSNLATRLARIEKLQSDSPDADGAIYQMIRESMGFIEWIAPDVALDLQVELLKLQRLLATWSHDWSVIQTNVAERKSVAEKSGEWSKRMLTASAVLQPAREVA